MPSNEQIFKILVLVHSMTFNCNEIQVFLFYFFLLFFFYDVVFINLSEATQRNVVWRSSLEQMQRLAQANK